MVQPMRHPACRIPLSAPSREAGDWLVPLADIGLRSLAEGDVMDRETILRQAHDQHLRLVRFMYCDNGGIIRGKASHVSGLERRMAEGIGQTLAMQAFAGVDALASVEGMGP